MPIAAVVSFRLGGSDGVSVEAAKWAWALEELGFSVVTVAGEGTADAVLPGLAMDATEPVDPVELADVLNAADLVVVENLCSLPLNRAALDAVASGLKGRPAILRHHDLPWQRPHFAHEPAPPDDPAWAHVTINTLSRRQLSYRGIPSTALYNRFQPPSGRADRAEAREAAGIDEASLVVLQPTRAIARKNIAGGLALAEALGATYWLTGPAEEGYGPEARRILSRSRVPVIRGNRGLGPAELYAACDVVVLPSTWEGFGNPTVESVLHRRPLAIGAYPVAAELAAFGFQWFPVDDPASVREFLEAGDEALLDRNHAVALGHFALADLPRELDELTNRHGWRFG